MPTSFHSPLLSFAMALSLAPATLLSAAGFEPVDATALFPVAGSTAHVVFSAPSQHKQGSEHPWRLIGYEGRVIETGKATVDDRGRLQLALNLPAGYYEVAFEDGGQATGLWSRPADPAPVDTFLGMDTAISWLTKPEQREALIQNLPKVTGAGGLARERLSWPQINPERDRWEWETHRQYDTTRRLYRQAGVPVLEVFHSTPKWVGNAQGGLFPEDLVTSHEAWREIVRRWQHAWGALEVWNEPEIRFGGHQPADQYVPLLKTIRHALHAVGADTPVVGGVFSAVNPGYLDLAARNGLLDESDVISFHYYGDPLGLQGQVAQYRDWLAKFGRETKPLWMTEVGLAYPPSPGTRPPLDVQADVSLTYAMQLVEARASGVERFFPFLYVDYSERAGTRNYGMQDRAGSPLRMLAASAQAGRALAGREYAGDVPLEKVAGARRIRVFAPAYGGADALIVLYTGRVSPGAEAELPFAIQSAQGIDGRALSVTAGARRAPVADGLVYLRVSPKQLDGILNPDTEAMRLYRLGKAAAPDLPSVSPVVLQPLVAPESLSAISATGYFLPPGATRLPVTLVVNNLGDAARTLSVRASGAPETAVTVEGGSRKKVPFEIDVSALTPRAAGTELPVTFTATADDGGRIAPAEIVLIPSSGISEHLQGSSYQFALAVNEAYRWDHNANGVLTVAHEPPAAWGFSVKFKPGSDRWAYPRYAIPQEVEQEKVSGVLVRARCLKPAIVRLLAWDGNDAMSMTRFSIIPADGEWHVAYVPLSTLTQVGYHDAGSDAVKLARIAVGFNSEADENALEISDLYLVGK